MGWLTLLWLAPALGGLLVFAPGKGRAPRWVALAVAAGVLAYSFWLLVPYSVGEGGWGLEEAGAPWLFGIQYHLAADGLSLVLCWLTAFLTVVCVLSSWEKEVSAAYWSAFLFLEAGVLGVFLARDLLVFYIFWEAVLLPMFFIIGVWGSDGRRKAAVKFFLFTFFGSLFLLLGILCLVTFHHAATGTWTWDMALLDGNSVPPSAAIWVLLCLLIGFGVKVPLVPLHTWLPDAHTEAPAAGSVMLAGVLLKMGLYGIMRLGLGAFSDLTWQILPWLAAAAAVNIIYGSICAAVQDDLKRLIAYSSVAHLGFCVLGVLSRTPEGLAGGTLQMVNHGLTTGALFLLVGALYEKGHKRGVGDFGDLVDRAPWLSVCFGVSILASIGVPGLNGFVGEFMCLAGITRVIPVFAVAGAAGIVLSAAYALPAYQRVFWGEPGPSSVSAKVTDLGTLDKAVLGLLLALMIWIGLCPGPLLSVIEPAAAALARAPSLGAAP